MEQKDIDMYMSTYWPDAEKVIVRPNGEDIRICGMDAIRANEKKAFEQSPILKISMSIVSPNRSERLWAVKPPISAT